MSRPPITCHVLDSSTGRPAADVTVVLEEYQGHTNGSASFAPLYTGKTNADGRCTDLMPGREDLAKIGKSLKAKTPYKMTFKTAEYFEGRGVQSFYPWVEIVFAMQDTDEHYHIPLLISPFGYTTYRGS
ncbi:transthyretin [Peniophora sp. CONT]|nr:transthyretin [Peniophora sp. CONT]